MWRPPGGHISPPQHSPPAEVLPARNQLQSSGPICFGSWRSSGTYAEYAEQTSTIISTELIRQQFEMPLEPRTYRLSRRIKRVKQRFQPYRRLRLDERICRKDSLAPWQERVLNGGVEKAEPFRILIKRKHRVTFAHPSYIESLETHNRHEYSTEARETQMISRSWIETSENQPLLHLQDTSIVSSFVSQTTNNRPLYDTENENRLSIDLTVAGSSSSRTIALEVDPSVPPLSVPNAAVPGTNNPVPLSSDTESVSFSPDLDMIQSSLNLSSPICDLQDLCTAENSESQLTNHDRSVEEPSIPSLSCYNDSCESPIIPYKICGLSMSCGPQPSALARHLASKIIKHARYNKTPSESSMSCPNCGLFPLLPVTGQCGHTRCTKCIHVYGSCPCGTQAPKHLHVNTIVQDMVKKIAPGESSARVIVTTSPLSQGEHHSGANCKRLLRTVSASSRHAAAHLGVHQRHSRGSRGSLFKSTTRLPVHDVPPHTLMSPQNRFKHARELLSSGQYREAAPHLARVAACSEPIPLARLARNLLAQTITVLSNGGDLRRLTRELYRSVRLQSAATWLKSSDLECVLCYHTYTQPVTTPCGHTYCRTCIERSMDYKKACALCLRPLDDFNLAATRETVFICAALASIDALNPPLPPDPDIIPIFVCTVAYPTIPCPLFIFDPRYWLMIRRVLESGSRKFGMVAYERDRTYSDYGTVLEVCDCVHLEDGRSILSTVGVSRFKVIERDVRDGCDVARIQPLTDITPTEELVIWDLRIMATQISYKALLWLNSMNRTVRSEIESAFGQLPHFDHREEDWWESPDGPAWLWWLIAILPLRSEIKVLILSTKNLLKRMMAVSRTLEAIDQVALTSTTTSECELQSALNNDEEWLERGA